MTSRPILFSAPMVRAILDGTKTQTRRVVKVAPKLGFYVPFRGLTSGREVWRTRDKVCVDRFCPYGEAGDRLWVRETWAAGDDLCDGRTPDPPEVILYRANNEARGFADVPPPPRGRVLDVTDWNFDAPCVHWKPSIHMPRWASRITLEVTDVRVERLQDISEEDAKAEGVAGVFFRASFAGIWDGINGDGAWDANPWVWAITFRRGAP